METKSSDVIKDTIGDWGKWQLRSVLLIFLCKIPSAWFMACIIFTAPLAQPGEFYCEPSKNVTSSNDSDWIHITHPIVSETADNKGFVYDYCNVYGNMYADTIVDENTTQQNQSFITSQLFEKQHEEFDKSKNTIPCNAFKHKSIYDSLVTQFDLVCSRTIWIAVTQFYHLFGVLTGGILATKLLDLYVNVKFSVMNL